MNRDDPFGYSLALVDGDLVLEKGGFQLVRGKSNLRQALELRVQTPFGSDIFNTTYGLDAKDVFTQPASLHQMQELIKVNLVRTLGTDPRVHDVRNVLFADDPAAPLLRSREETRALINGRSWPVQVVIETVNAQTETLSFNIGV